MIHFVAPRALSLSELEEVDELLKDWALVSIAEYGLPSNPRYAALWHDTGTLQRPRTFVTAANSSEPLGALAFGSTTSEPVLWTGTGDVSDKGEVGVHTTWVTRSYSSDDPARAVAASALSQVEEGGRTCLSLDAVYYRPAGQDKPVTRYLALLKREAGFTSGVFETPKGQIADGLSGFFASPPARQAQLSFKRFQSAVPASRAEGGKRRVTALMRSNAYTAWPDDEDALPSTVGAPAPGPGGTFVDGPLTAQQFDESVEARRAAQFLPIHVGANGKGSSARFCVTYAASEEVLGRRFFFVQGADPHPNPRVPPAPSNTPVGAEVTDFPGYPRSTRPRLAAMLSEIRTQMSDRGIKNAQVAIAVDGRLKLFWSLTRGEENWVMTRPDHKFRFASSAKILTAMRAVGLDTEHGFLHMPLAEALGITSIPPVPNPYDPTSLQNWAKRWLAFSKIRVVDCLRHTSGMTVDNQALYDGVFELAGQTLPLEPGQIATALSAGLSLDPKFFPHEPRTYEDYNNNAYSAAGEAVGRIATGSTRNYFDAQVDWWPLNGNLRQVIQIPATRAESLMEGEPWLVSPTCVRRDSLVKGSVLQDAGLELPAFLPGGYAAQRDFRITEASGGLSMSAATFVRLLHMLHPLEAPSPRSGRRLPLVDILKMTIPQTGTVATPESAEAEPSWGLGAKVVTTTEPLFAPWGPVGSHRVELTWGGTLGEGQSGFSHFLWMNDLLSPSDVRTMSVAAVTNTNRRLGDFDADGHWTSKIRDEALALMQEGGWDSADIDLFPDLDLD